MYGEDHSGTSSCYAPSALTPGTGGSSAGGSAGFTPTRLLQAGKGSCHRDRGRHRQNADHYLTRDDPGDRVPSLLTAMTVQPAKHRPGHTKANGRAPISPAVNHLAKRLAIRRHRPR